jgi:hypothetical protein
MRGSSFASRNRNLIVTTAALGAMTLLSGIALYILLTENVPELYVEQTYFEAPRRTGDRIPIEVVSIITNEGKAMAENVRVEVLAIETDSNLARGNGTSIMFDLGAKKSQEIRSTVMVPRNATFRLEILIFRAEKLTIWGSGIVDLTGLGKASLYKTDANLDDPKEKEEKDGASSSLCILFLLIAGGVGGLVIIIVYIGKKGGGKGPEPLEKPDKAPHIQPMRRPKGYEDLPDPKEDPKIPGSW